MLSPSQDTTPCGTPLAMKMQLHAEMPSVGLQTQGEQNADHVHIASVEADVLHRWAVDRIYRAAAAGVLVSGLMATWDADLKQATVSVRQLRVPVLVGQAGRRLTKHPPSAAVASPRAHWTLTPSQ